MKPDEIIRWLVFGLPLTGSVSQVPAHAQQQQHVHSEQVEGEQQRRALAGAEGHSQHPHPPRAAASGLQEGEGERGREKGGEVRGNPRYRGYYGDTRGSSAQPYSSDGSIWWLDENGSFGVLVLLCRAPLSLALTANPENKRTSAERQHSKQIFAALIFYCRYRLSRSCVAISCSSATDRCCISSSSLTWKSKQVNYQIFLLLLVSQVISHVCGTFSAAL